MTRTEYRWIALVWLAMWLHCPSINAYTPEIEYEARFTATVGTGDFAPYYLSSNRHGALTQRDNTLLGLRAEKHLDLGRRWDYAFGAEAIGGWSSATGYDRYTAGSGWSVNRLRPSAVMLQQLYGMVKWRGVYLSVGMKHHDGYLLDHTLSSGDLIESGNARPLPEARVGLVDFQDIPFTNGWVQIQGEVSYGRFMDNKWWREHYNYYNSHITQGSLSAYRRCYFRTNPRQPFSVTVGAQVVTIFGGTAYYYDKDRLWRERHMSRSFKSFIEAFLPIHDEEMFRLGNSIGSWDLKARYRLPSGKGEVSAYFEWPWEDGSGIGRRNGWDGLWGVSYHVSGHRWVEGAVAEYLDFTNQSGPLHWSPTDRPGTSITSPATGADDYYNNVFYNAYANYGLSIGSPMLKAPLFNTDGYPQYTATRLRGFHVAARGHVGATSVRWHAAISYRKAWGSGYVPMVHPVHDFSMMLRGSAPLGRVRGLVLSGAVAIDRGTLLGNNFGVEISVAYNGLLSAKTPRHHH